MPNLDGPPPYRLNKPHYHPWLMASTGRIFYKCAAKNSRQAARQWAMRRQPDPEKRDVRPCYDPRCQPKLPE